jgi:hypothetical protein
MAAERPPVRALLEGLIDYAGLFPPAKLDMRPAVENYAAYLAGPDAWALGVDGVYVRHSGARRASAA